MSAMCYESRAGWCMIARSFGLLSIELEFYCTGGIDN
jgi:hypothetical protein